MTNLIIVESPTKAKTLGRFLGDTYKVDATMGHIMDLPKSKLSVDLENNFEPLYVPMDKKKDTIARIQKEALSASSIFIATDPDREGEAIASHVAEILQTGKKKIAKSKMKRIVFHEITKSAVEHAISEPRDVDTHLVNAQIARRVLDRLVGYKLSPLLWKKVRRGLSAGRVQSVAVRLIVEREREILAFKPEEYWEISSLLKVQKESVKIKEFLVSLIKIDEKKAEVHDEKTAKAIISDLEKATYAVSDIKKREVKKHAFAPFTTSTMTQAAARMFGWSAKRTMSIAQKLYEEGLITYHRTDSTNIADQAIAMARAYIESSFGADYLPQTPNLFKTKSKVAQEAHEAIRPTDLSRSKTSDSKDIEAAHWKLYDLIWKRFVACQMSDARYDETTIDVRAASQLQSTHPTYMLRAGGQIMKFDGWRKVLPSKSTGETEQELPSVEKDEVLPFVRVLSEQKFTQPPPRYNEASIIKTLEKLGIGRPSTYAPIISTIQLRGYVEKTEGKFLPTAVGMAANDFLVTNFPEELEYSFTAHMEGNLDDIANGKTDWHAMMHQFYTPFEKKLGSVDKTAERVKIATEGTGKKCPKCSEGEIVVRTGRFGKFLSCSRFPECDYKDKYLQKIEMKCPDCKKGDVIVKKTGKGRIFYGCSLYPDCKYASWKDPRPKKAFDEEPKSMED